AFLGAMLAKGSVAILPLVLLVIIWWQHDRITGHDLLATTPFFVIAGGLTVVNIWFQTHGQAGVIRDLTMWQRIAGAVATVWFYLYKSLVPIQLAFIYPSWHIKANQLLWWLPTIAAVLVTSFLFWQRHNRWLRPVLFAWMLFCITLLPVMGFT